MRWQTPLILALLLSIWFAPRAQANSILNGGFEASGFADSMVQPGGSGSLVFEGGSAHTGHAAAWFGAVGAIADTISEVFSTNPGESYTATFWLAHPSSDHANSFTVLWDGLPILTLVNATRFGYTEYTFVEQAVGTLDDFLLRPRHARLLRARRCECFLSGNARAVDARAVQLRPSWPAPAAFASCVLIRMCSSERSVSR